MINHAIPVEAAIQLTNRTVFLQDDTYVDKA